MAKATLKLPNGTSVLIEGTTDEVAKLLELYSGDGKSTPRRSSPSRKSKRRKLSKLPPKREIDLAEIVNLVKTCEEAELIEVQVLDKAASVNRVLLPLYVVHEHKENSFGLTSGDVSIVTKDLGIPISTPNASRTLSGAAKRYVIGDRVRRKGQAVRYKLTRNGVKYFRSILSSGE